MAESAESKHVPLETPENKASSEGSETLVKEDATAKRADDVVLLGGPTPDGKGVHVLRAREGGIEVGAVCALEEGQPITGDVVTLAPRPQTPRICDVKVHYSAPRSRAARDVAKKGPAQVATDEYRERYEAVFGPDTSASVRRNGPAN